MTDSDESFTVSTGVDRLCSDVSLLTRYDGTVARGLFTNFTGTMPDLTRNIDSMLGAGITLSALFSPEHGLWGSAQAGETEPAGVDEYTGLPVYDTYRRQGKALDAVLHDSGITELVIDLQDCGVRFYTYIWSMFDVMVSAARLCIPVTVLDRPNPLGCLEAQGPGLLAECSSFVGRVSIPLIHSMTMGELAGWFNAAEVPELAGRPAELQVIRMANWNRKTPVADAVRPWVSPSLNLPTPTTAHVYPGTCLFEGTNASEGRGTTHPFEMIGAGWVDARYVQALRERELPGVLFREIYFVPTFDKWQSERIRGVQLHVVDPVAFQPLQTGVAMIQAMAKLYPGDFQFLVQETEGNQPFIDLLWGSDVLRTRTDLDYPSLLAASPKPRTIDTDIRLYA
ncbi:MAG: DUF1343 domain-containing protein [Lacisediminihabitans sp.]